MVVDLRGERHLCVTKRSRDYLGRAFFRRMVVQRVCRESCPATRNEFADLRKAKLRAKRVSGMASAYIARARFYYAAGYGVKSHESKYERADPGVSEFRRP
jgi:hypothetical protein